MYVWLSIARRGDSSVANGEGTRGSSSVLARLENPFAESAGQRKTRMGPWFGACSFPLR